MTWKEFKAAVERAGVKDDEELWYIDFSGDPHHGFDGAPTIGRQDGLGVSIGD